MKYSSAIATLSNYQATFHASAVTFLQADVNRFSILSKNQLVRVILQVGIIVPLYIAAYVMSSYSSKLHQQSLRITPFSY